MKLRTLGLLRPAASSPATSNRRRPSELSP